MQVLDSHCPGPFMFHLWQTVRLLSRTLRQLAAVTNW